MCFPGRVLAELTDNGLGIHRNRSIHYKSTAVCLLLLLLLMRKVPDGALGVWEFLNCHLGRHQT